VGVGATEDLLGHVLLRHGLHYVGAGHKHVRRVLHLQQKRARVWKGKNELTSGCEGPKMQQQMSEGGPRGWGELETSAKIHTAPYQITAE
jgi:hypothetical protein